LLEGWYRLMEVVYIDGGVVYIDNRGGIFVWRRWYILIEKVEYIDGEGGIYRLKRWYILIEKVAYID